jgi:hypothetical protein
VRRIRAQLDIVFPDWDNHLPPDPGDSCCLTTTDNIFGRLVNAASGAADSDVCTVETHCDDVTGEFAHIEQKEITTKMGDGDKKRIRCQLVLNTNRKMTSLILATLSRYLCD